jgi:hypothetical protein
MRRMIFPVGLLVLSFLAVTGGIIAVSLHPDPLPKRFAIASEELQAMTHLDGVRTALDRLREVADGADSDLATACHGLAHQIGHAALDRYGFADALQYEDDICGSGYLHGVIEAHFAGIPDADIPAVFAAACPPGSPKCFHGLGHGLMAAYDDDIDRSLTLCHTLGHLFQKAKCAEGVFMERFASNGHPTPSTAPGDDAADPFAVCRGRELGDRNVCVFYAPRAFLTLHPDEYTAAVTWCRASDPLTVPLCLKGLGSAAMKAHITKPLTAVVACDNLDGTDRAACIEGLISYEIVHFADPERGRSLCPALPDADQPACRKAVADGELAYGD